VNLFVSELLLIKAWLIIEIAWVMRNSSSSLCLVSAQCFDV